MRQEGAACSSAVAPPTIADLQSEGVAGVDDVRQSDLPGLNIRELRGDRPGTPALRCAPHLDRAEAKGARVLQAPRRAGVAFEHGSKLQGMRPVTRELARDLKKKERIQY